MITIKIINLLLICLGFASLMWAFAQQVKFLKIRFTGARMAKFYFLLAALGMICREIWILRFSQGTTVAIWNLWAVLVAYLLTRYHPFKTERDSLAERTKSTQNDTNKRTNYSHR